LDVFVGGKDDRMINRAIGALGTFVVTMGIVAGVALADPPTRVLEKICSRNPDHPHCQARIEFISPTPPDGAVVTPPFTLNVQVTSPVPVALVRYFFFEPSGAMSSANRETETGYAFTVQNDGANFAQIFERSTSVIVRACAYSAESPNDFENPLACTERTFFSA
jgi:hypothetical protein